jgi:D-glycero-alpha-D-manno-heptose-7-phosphate kinase
MSATSRIHSAAPVRVCDIGGWTDTWFARRGAVLNIAVTPYVEVQVTPSPRSSDERVTLHLDNYGDSYSVNPDELNYGKHPLIEAIVREMVIPEDLSLAINIHSTAPSGASVGTSAAVSVALIGALDALTPGTLIPHQVAALAHHIETEKLHWQSGIQDQICSAYGGVNFIWMPAYPQPSVSPVRAPEAFLWELERRLALVYIGTPHNSSEVHKKVIADLGEDASADPRIDGLRRLAEEAKDAACAGDLSALGDIMDRNTEFQRRLHPALVCEKFEEIIDVARRYGACGCKVNGAGGDGGSITILSGGDLVKKRRMLTDLRGKGYHYIPVSLSLRGLTVWKDRYGI